MKKIAAATIPFLLMSFLFFSSLSLLHAQGVGSSCNDDSDCAVGTTCGSGGQCVATSGIGQGCEDDSDCAVGETCADGECTNAITSICTTNADCESGQVCQNSQCIAGTTGGNPGGTVTTGGNPGGTVTTGGNPGATANCSSGSGAGCIPNPLGANTSICTLITDIINLVAELGAIIAVLFLLLSGFQFIRAQGNPEKIKEAKRTFFYTLIGIAILLGAYVIVQIIWGTINSIITLPGGTCT